MPVLPWVKYFMKSLRTWGKALLLGRLEHLFYTQIFLRAHVGGATENHSGNNGATGDVL